jgi:SAM-dependent methyltransferase
MREARTRGLKVRGIENSPYILERIRDRTIRDRIQVGNAADLIREIEPGSFDLILECAAQYLPPHRLDRYLKNLARLEPNMVCLLVDPRNYQGDRGAAHTGVRTFETITWWKKKMREAGFEHSVNDFFFFKA